MGMPVTVTLSSAGTSRAVNLDYLKGTPVGVTVTTSAAGAGSSTGTVFTIQLTLDDLTTNASPTWVNDPNFTTVGTSLATPSSGVILYQQPLAGIRLNSTTSSGVTLTMKVNQALGLG